MENFKVIFYMGSPIISISPIILDSLISLCKAKEILGEKFYMTQGNISGSIEEIEAMLNPILDKKYGVYCTSYGIGDFKEYKTTWSKRWDSETDEVVRLSNSKKRVDVGAGHYKNYHMPMLVKSYKTLVFYVRGDMKEIKRLLETYLTNIGKKASQGYGEILKMEFIKTQENYSIEKDNKLMRHIPAKNNISLFDEKYNNICLTHNFETQAILPPYWRKEKELCIMPNIKY